MWCWVGLGVSEAEWLTRYRTLVYLEGDATMKSYEDKSGQQQTSLSLVQTKVEVLKRPQAKDEVTE